MLRNQSIYESFSFWVFNHHVDPPKARKTTSVSLKESRPIRIILTDDKAHVLTSKAVWALPGKQRWGNLGKPIHPKSFGK